MHFDSFVSEETFAAKIRGAGSAMREAEEHIARAQAVEKKVVAEKMLEAEGVDPVKNKSAAAQIRYADSTDAVYHARLEIGVARGMLAAAKGDFEACRIEFEKWRTDQASERLEKRTYQ